jgi:hypothetical protein
MAFHPLKRNYIFTMIISRAIFGAIKAEENEKIHTAARITHKPTTRRRRKKQSEYIPKVVII